MATPDVLAKSAREKLAQALNALQTSADTPVELLDMAEPIAQAMGILHRIERSQGRDLTGREQVLTNVRGTLDKLQQLSISHEAVDAVMEQVAGCLSSVHQLSRAQPVGAPASAASAPASAAAAPAPAPAPAPVAVAPVAAAPVVAPVAPSPSNIVANIPPPAAPSPAPQPTPVMAAPAPVAIGGTMAMQQPSAPIPQAAPVQSAPPVQAAPVQAAPVQAAPVQAAFPPPPVQPVAAAPQQPVAAAPVAQPVSQPSVKAGGTMRMQADPAIAATAAAPMAHAPAPVAPTQPVATRAGSSSGVPSTAGGNVVVELGTHSVSNFYKGLSGNDVIEHGGIFVATYRIPKMGMQVNLRVLLPGDYEFQATGIVQWIREASASGEASEPGFGAKFTQITPEGRQLVYRYTRNREPMFYDDL
ncbi:MAG: hypothetical protein HOW73_28130 [Polyangiaceae bacterium]|nr:hypothetical protein [Polyangiaceae bacterium]